MDSGSGSRGPKLVPVYHCRQSVVQSRGVWPKAGAAARRSWLWRLGRLLLCGMIGGMLITAPASGQTQLRRGNGAEPHTLDPHKATLWSEFHILYDLFEGLVTPGAKGEIQPGAAERWTISPDRLTYTFYMRPNARWSNGMPLTAHDFVYSLRRALSRGTVSPHATLLLPIRHADEVLNGTRPPDHLSVTAPDPRTLVITLEVPCPTLLQRLMHPVAMPVPRLQIEEFGDAWLLAGRLASNGAYRLAEAVRGVSRSLLKNSHYHGAAQVSFDSVVYVSTPYRRDEVRRFRAGQLATTFEVPTDQVKSLLNAPEFRHSPFFGTYYYVFNLTRAPFKDNPGLRQALYLALDREALIAGATQVDDIPAHGLVPPGLVGYTPQAPFPDLTPPQRRELARKLFTESGYRPENPLTVELLFNKSENHRHLAEGMAMQWQEVFGKESISVILVGQGWPDFQQTRGEGNFLMARMSWIGDFLDPTAFLEPFLATTPGVRSRGGWSNAAFDLAIYRAQWATDPTTRQYLLEEAERILMADLPVLPLYHYRTRYLVHPQLLGWETNLRDIHPSRFLAWGM